jgi:hemerythrin-like metal-binding protein
MSIIFEWDNSFSVANEEIDQQHKMLFDLANSIGDDLNQQQIKKNIIVLYKYTREHFAAEEKMMQKISYPKFEEHKELHKDLITKLNTIDQRFIPLLNATDKFNLLRIVSCAINFTGLAQWLKTVTLP